jgi:hypothetical protein
LQGFHGTLFSTAREGDATNFVVETAIYPLKLSQCQRRGFLDPVREGRIHY